MNDSLPFQLLADAVLSLHVAVVVFVVGGQVFIIVGNLRAWHWVNALWFRLVHLAAIAVVIAEAWIGAACPLTSLEMWLRTRARSTAYAGSFIEHWFQRILYYDAPAWAFTLAYSAFGLVVIATWWYLPPSSTRHSRGRHATKPGSAHRDYAGNSYSIAPEGQNMSKYCQSCGMPLSKDPQIGGTNSDGKKSEDYCSLCLAGGTFTAPDFTAKQMQAFCVEKMREKGIPRPLGWLLTRNITKLKRWKSP